MNKRAPFFKFKYLKFVDWFLVINIVVISLFGIVAIVNATAKPFTGEEQTIGDYLAKIDFQYPVQQLIWLAISLVFLFLTMLPDYHNVGEYVPWIYWINVVLLVAVLFFADKVNGSTAWIDFGFAKFQPGETAKIAIIITLAKMVSDKTRDREGITKFRDILMIVASFSLPLVLIMLQPDWGTAFVYAVIFFGILLVAKTSFRIIAAILGTGLALIPASWFIMSEYQQQRILDFFNPKDTSILSQVNQAKIAIGSGQVTGKGFFSAGALGQLDYVPFDHTDFIFSVTIEPIGFVGGIILLLLYFTLIFRALYLAMKAKDDFGKFIVVGVVCMTVFHIFQNIGMNMGIMPVTGIPLPFFSYGGSNLLTNMISFGLILNVNMRRFRWSF